MANYKTKNEKKSWSNATSWRPNMAIHYTMGDPLTHSRPDDEMLYYLTSRWTTTTINTTFILEYMT